MTATFTPFVPPPLPRIFIRRRTSFRPIFRACAAGENNVPLSELRVLQRQILDRRRQLRANASACKQPGQPNSNSSNLPSTSPAQQSTHERERITAKTVSTSVAQRRTLHTQPASVDAVGQVLVRHEGNLPWTKKRESVAHQLPSEYVFPSLSRFLSPTFPRSNGSLPRVSVSPTILQTIQREYESAPASSKYSTRSAHFIVDGLNPSQQRAVLTDIDCPCLVLAGPGSGKTRVLTHRLAYLVAEHDISPFKLLAVTFTNKAAREMKQRVASLLLPNDASTDEMEILMGKLPVGTFHSLCARFLRQFGSEIDIPNDFAICDSTDAKALVKRILKTSSVATADADVAMIMRSISGLKNDVRGEMKAKFKQMPDILRRIEEQRFFYDRELRKMNLLDFDDLLLEMRRLLLTSSNALSHLCDRFEQVLVDEFQDTNVVQFDIVSMLAGKRKNLFVVGDADQSIYKFRGADTSNERRFFDLFPNAQKINLDTNYRSSKRIVEASQSVIEKDRTRMKKNMVAVKGLGEPIRLCETYDAKGEADFIVRTISEQLRKKTLNSLSNVALLYRMNAQSRSLEEAFIRRGIPYYIRSGVRFYERKEIKDLIAYVSVVAKPEDDIAFLRIVNTPARGIGPKAIEAIEEYARQHNVPLSVAAEQLVQKSAEDEKSVTLRKGTAAKIDQFCQLIESLRMRARRLDEESRDADVSSGQKGFNLSSLFEYVVQKVQYIEYLERTSEAKKASDISRIDNVNELILSANKYNSLQAFLENVALLTDSGNDSGNSSGAVSLMTLHACKGLEFDTVFITGCEDGVIPLVRGSAEKVDIDEERRLLYVGMTRAMSDLYICWRANRLGSSGGRTFVKKTAGGSRFLRAIPKRMYKLSLLPSANSDEESSRYRSGRN